MLPCYQVLIRPEKKGWVPICRLQVLYAFISRWSESHVVRNKGNTT